MISSGCPSDEKTEDDGDKRSQNERESSDPMKGCWKNTMWQHILYAKISDGACQPKPSVHLSSDRLL